MSSPFVAVLMPTRGRPKLYRQSVQALRDLALWPDRVSVVLRRDSDDLTGYPSMRGVDTFIFGKALGYAGLHVYYNECAESAIMRGARWLMIWNDDCVMQSRHWDAHLWEPMHLRQWMADAHNHFPIVSDGWYKAAGRVAASPHADTYIGHVAEILITGGLIERPVERLELKHLADELDDEGTARRKQEILGPDGTSARFFRPEMRAEIEKDAKAIAASIKESRAA